MIMMITIIIIIIIIIIITIIIIIIYNYIYSTCVCVCRVLEGRPEPGREQVHGRVARDDEAPDAAAGAHRQGRHGGEPARQLPSRGRRPGAAVGRGLRLRTGLADEVEAVAADEAEDDAGGGGAGDRQGGVAAVANQQAHARRQGEDAGPDDVLGEVQARPCAGLPHELQAPGAQLLPHLLHLGLDLVPINQ